MSNPFQSRIAALTLAVFSSLAVPMVTTGTDGSPEPGESKSSPKVITAGYSSIQNLNFQKADGDSIHLKADQPLAILPDTLRVTENTQISLPGIDVQAGAAWFPAIKSKDLEAQGVMTRVDWRLYINDRYERSASFEKEGVPTIKEWKDWYDDEKPYLYGNDLTNERLRMTFDLAIDAEAFTEGNNSVHLQLWGETYVWRNNWDPSDWRHRKPVEWTEYETLITQTKYVEVQPPYVVWKTPPINVSTQEHQADLTVQLWDKNTARIALKGNVQDFEDPTIVTAGPNGRIGPGGTATVKTETHVHTGTHPPVMIRVLPDFDPINVDVVHREWDVKGNRGKVYRRHILLNPTVLYCVQAGDTSSTPATPPPAPEMGVPTGGQKARRNIASAGGRVAPQGVPGPMEDIKGIARVRIVSLVAGNPTLDLDATPDSDDEWMCNDCVESGDTVELQYWFRDIFGQHYEDAITVDIPDSLDLAASDTVVVRQPILVPTLAETDLDPDLTVDVHVMDLAATPFGIVRGLPGLQVDDLLGGYSGLTDADGRFTFEVPHGTALEMSVTDPFGTFMPLTMPETPPLETHLAHREVEVDGWKDDRMYLWLTPGFDLGRLHPACGVIDQDEGLFVSHVGAVSDFATDEVTDAYWETLDGDFLMPAAIRPWGATPRDDLGYVPVLFGLAPLPPATGDDPFFQAALQEVVNAGGARLVVMADGLDHTVEIPYEEGYVSGVEDTPRAGLTHLRVAPNPFNPMTRISFELKKAGTVKLDILNIDGRRVTMLIDGHRGAGEQNVTWHGVDSRGAAVASGVYFARLRAEGIESSVTLVLVR